MGESLVDTLAIALCEADGKDPNTVSPRNVMQWQEYIGAAVTALKIVLAACRGDDEYSLHEWKMSIVSAIDVYSGV